MKRIETYDNYIKKAISEGIKTRDIAKLIGFSENTVYKRVKELGLKSVGSKRGDSISIKNEDIELILKLYTEEKRTIQEIFNIFDEKYTAGSINYLLRLKGVTRRRGAQIHLNENYFSIIDTPQKAYFLGLMFADGCVRRTNELHDSWSIGLELVSTDKYVIEAFRDELDLKLEVKDSHRKNRNPTSYLHFQSSKIAKDLISLGCIPNKSSKVLSFPCISSELRKYFILGYFDGDGIASNAKRRYIGFCGSEPLLIGIESILREELSLNYKRVYFNKSNNIYYLCYANKEEIEKIYNYFYENPKTIYIKRKREKLILN